MSFRRKSKTHSLDIPVFIQRRKTERNIPLKMNMNPFSFVQCHQSHRVFEVRATWVFDAAYCFNYKIASVAVKFPRFIVTRLFRELRMRTLNNRLFSLGGLLPHFKPCDNTLENSCSQIFK